MHDSPHASEAYGPQAVEQLAQIGAVLAQMRLAIVIRSSMAYESQHRDANDVQLIQHIQQDCCSGFTCDADVLSEAIVEGIGGAWCGADCSLQESGIGSAFSSPMLSCTQHLR